MHGALGAPANALLRDEGPPASSAPSSARTIRSSATASCPPACACTSGRTCSHCGSGRSGRKSYAWRRRRCGRTTPVVGLDEVPAPAKRRRSHGGQARAATCPPGSATADPGRQACRAAARAGLSAACHGMSRPPVLFSDPCRRSTGPPGRRPSRTRGRARSRGRGCRCPVGGRRLRFLSWPRTSADHGR